MTRRSGFPLDVLCVLSGIARSMAPSGLKKALSFRAVELALRLEGTLGGWLRVLQFCHSGRQDGVEATSRNIATGTREGGDGAGGRCSSCAGFAGTTGAG